MSDVDLRQLRCFVAVAKELHFTRAAERMGIDQSGLSKQIRALERCIGVRLLWRHSRCTHLTQAGLVLLVEAERILSVVDSIKDESPGATGDRTEA